MLTLSRRLTASPKKPFSFTSFISSDNTFTPFSFSPVYNSYQSRERFSIIAIVSALSNPIPALPEAARLFILTTSCCILSRPSASALTILTKVSCSGLVNALCIPYGSPTISSSGVKLSLGNILNFPVSISILSIINSS